MSKPKSIQINIPQPCSQNRDEMTVMAGGRFCGQCQKTVIDFSTWSDTALYNFFSKNNEHVCGTFLTTQLERPIHIPYQPHSRLYRMTVALGLTLLFTQTPHLLAQNRPPKIVQTDTLIQKQAGELSGELVGAIYSKNQERIPGAFVQVLRNGHIIVSDTTNFEGNFTFTSIEPGYYDVLVVAPGYDSMIDRSVVIAPGQRTTQNFIIPLTKPDRPLDIISYKTGGIVVPAQPQKNYVPYTPEEQKIYIPIR